MASSVLFILVILSVFSRAILAADDVLEDFRLQDLFSKRAQSGAPDFNVAHGDYPFTEQEKLDIASKHNELRKTKQSSYMNEVVSSFPLFSFLSYSGFIQITGDFSKNMICILRTLLTLELLKP